jgi:dihydrofolate reductase
MPKHFKAIAAMSLNRVIGKENKLPWHIPDELKWFKKMTTGNVIIMGRKTWESIGKPLPNRETIVLSGSPLQLSGVKTVKSLEGLPPESDSRDYFIVGGARLFTEMLRRCSDLYLTVVKREVEGDVFFPKFEENFRLIETIQETPEYSILHYRNQFLN